MRSIDGIEDPDTGSCLSTTTCDPLSAEQNPTLPTTVALCSHCGTNDWNILGDAETGYVLVRGDGDQRACLVRDKEKRSVYLADCDSKDHAYTPLHLHFASAHDITTMQSTGARLVSAAHMGNVEAIQSVLEAAHDENTDTKTVDTPDWDGVTALIAAASAGHVPLVQFLLEQGASIAAADKDGVTALHEASLGGHDAIVRLLLDQEGATVDVTAQTLVTPLWLAASAGHSNTIQLLLEHEADAKVARDDGVSAVQTAAVGGHVDAVRVLLQAGASATSATKDQVTPLMNAAEGGNVEVVRLLLDQLQQEHANLEDEEQKRQAITKALDDVSATGLTAIILAAAHGHAEVARLLIDAGAHASQREGVDVTPLMYAAASNHVNVMEVLIEHGRVNIEETHSTGGSTAFLEACTGGSVEAIELLLRHGANPQVTDADDVTPLMAVASNGSVKGQQVVLDSLRQALNNDEESLREYINRHSENGGSAVMFAAAGGHTDCTRQLIELGANLEAVAKATVGYLERLEKRKEDGSASPEEVKDPHVDGVTALHVAAQGGHQETVKLLLQHAPQVAQVKDDLSRTPLSLAINGNHAATSEALISAGADPNTPYIDESNVQHNMLFDSLVVENERFAKLLIEKGASIYYMDEKRVSTLLQASQRGFTDVVRLITEKHASNANIPNQYLDYLNGASEEGVTPLMAAASEGHTEIVKLLLQYQTSSSSWVALDVNTPDSDNTTALMAASARGHVDVVRQLIKAGSKLDHQNRDGHSALMFAYNGKAQVEALWERYNDFVNDNKDEQRPADDSGTGPILRKALDDHLAVVEVLLKSGADTKLKDKEGHTAKDLDFHPDSEQRVQERAQRLDKIRDESKNEL